MKMRSILPLRKKLYLTMLKNSIVSRCPIKASSVQRIWIFLAADYGNLGDVAITKAQHRFLQSQYPTSEVCEVPISQTLKFLPHIHKIVGKDDIITIVGGGNMGDLYDDIEYLRQLVIRIFPKHTIISFPQSIFFSDTPYGQKRLKEAQRVYNNHPALTLFARDSMSYAQMQKFYPQASVKLCPDIVLFQDCRKQLLRNRTALFCLRKDKERTTQNIAKIQALNDYIADSYDNVEFTDTQIDDNLVRKNGGQKYLDQILDIFSHAGLVITDRLHGMIFAYITQTPALVFDNNTHKISSTYSWIKDCGFIHLVHENTDFRSLRFEDNFATTKTYLDSFFQKML